MVFNEQDRGKFRQSMPVCKNFAYFDHAAVSPLPSTAGEAIVNFARQSTQEGDTRWLEWASGLQRTRSLAAQLIGADSSEIALVSNTTTGIGMVAEGLRWQLGDNVVVPENEFPSNLLPWKNLVRRGVEVRLVPIGEDGQIDADQIIALVDSRTRLVALSWVGFLSGFRCDLAEISKAVHAGGSLLLVDAIQGLGAFPLNVRELGIDFAVADGHKWMLGPEGAGILYVSQKCMDLLDTIGVGWNSLAAGGFDPRSERLKASAGRLEGGSYNMAGLLALGASLELLLQFGSNSTESGFHQAILANVRQLSQQLEQHGFWHSLPHQRERQSGILGIRWEQADAEGESAYQRARTFLLQRKVVVSVRGGRIRAASHVYNNADDIQQLVDALVDFRSSAS